MAVDEPWAHTAPVVEPPFTGQARGSNAAFVRELGLVGVGLLVDEAPLGQTGVSGCPSRMSMDFYDPFLVLQPVPIGRRYPLEVTSQR